MKTTLIPLLLLSSVLLTNCQSSNSALSNQQEAVSPQPTTINKPTAVRIQPSIVSTQPPIPNTPTPIPSPQPATAVSTSTPTPQPTSTPTPAPCAQRLPNNDLLAVITKTYGMSRNYTPDDLLSLNDYLPNEITLGYPIEIRAIMLDPLTQLISDMQMAELQPQTLSGYRSYSAQSIAFDKWLQEFPERAAILSAPPGHSEHQLGTTIDFGSPNLSDYIDDPNLQFHTYFYKTPEGIWLAENAYKYGFTLSYPREAFELTGFYYEPWHYRYVGTEMATQLYDMGLSLAEFQFNNQAVPCIP